MVCENVKLGRARNKN